VQIKNSKSMKIIGLMLLALLLVISCAKKGEKPQANLPPDTIVSGFQIATAPSLADKYSTTVYWRSSDPDGSVADYRWRVIGNDGDSVMADTLNLSRWQSISDVTVTIELAFPNLERTYSFEVAARDNSHVWDPTPAVAILAKDRITGLNYPPNTEILSGPSDGGITAAGVHFQIQGFDIDGVMDSLDYKLDTTTAWTRVGADINSGTASLDIVGLDLGAHTAIFRAVDNFGAVDPSPISVSFVVVDTLLPYLTVTGGALPDAFYYLPAGGTTANLATGWHGDATWYSSTLLYRYAVDDTATWSEWDTATSVTLTGLTAESHVFYVEAKDLADHITLFATNFRIGPFIADRGILVVNGVDWASYAAQATAMYTAHAPWGNRPNVDFWDLFSGDEGYYPPVIDSLGALGTGIIPGDTLGHYSTMVMMMNSYSGGSYSSDLEVFNSMRPLILSYLQAGGNIVMGTRYGQNFIDTTSTLYGYTHIRFNEIGANPVGLVAAVDGLVDQPAIASQTLTDLLAIPSNPEVTTLFTVAAFPHSVGGVIVEPATGGKFAFIAGRCYRFDNAAMAANYDYILSHYMGE
jgi:hypothetical protein